MLNIIMANYQNKHQNQILTQHFDHPELSLDGNQQTLRAQVTIRLAAQLNLMTLASS